MAGEIRKTYSRGTIIGCSCARVVWRPYPVREMRFVGHDKTEVLYAVGADGTIIVYHALDCPEARATEPVVEAP